MMGMGGMAGMWGYGALLVVGVVVLVVVGVRLAARRGGGERPAPPSTGAGPSRASSVGPDPSAPTGPSGPREVLDRRYADGEIDTEEYQERRRALGQEQ